MCPISAPLKVPLPRHVELAPATEAALSVPLGPLRHLAVQGAVDGTPGLQDLGLGQPSAPAVGDRPLVPGPDAAGATTPDSWPAGVTLNGQAAGPGSQCPLVMLELTGAPKNIKNIPVGVD